MRGETGNQPVLEIKDLQVGFRSIAGTTRAVNGVSLDVHAGEIVGLVGESGCGKSVTIRSIAGLVPSPPAIYEGGEIWMKTRRGRVNTLALHHDSKEMRSLRGRDVSMIFQEPMRSLHPMIPIGKQIVEGLLEHEIMEPRQAFDRTVEMLDLVGLPNPQSQMTRYAHELSGGMRQRVLIALALVGQPHLLLADEPTTALDVTIQAQILNLIRSLRERMGMSVLLITHNMGVVANLADRISVMYLGRIIERGPVSEVFRHPAHPYTQGLLASIPSVASDSKAKLYSMPGIVPELAQAPQGCVFADRCPFVMRKCNETPPYIDVGSGHQAACWLHLPGEHLVRNVDVRLIEPDAVVSATIPTRVSATVHEDFPASANGRSAANAQGESALLTVDNVKLHYPILKGLLRRRVGTVQAVDDVNLVIHRGETLGIVGESGCGKTSLGRMLPRLVEPTAGRISFAFEEDLRDITDIPQARMKQVRRAMGMVFQDPMSSLNPRMNVRTIVSEPLILHDLARGKQVSDRAGELLEIVGLKAEHQNRFPHAFSGGQRQRIAIARALATQPKFVVADEPVSSLDVSVQAQILNLLMDLQRKLELSMLFIAHDIAVVRHVSDRIAVMYLGRIVETGMAHEVCAKPAHPYTEALLASIPHPIPGYNQAKNIPQGDLPDPADPPKGCRFHTRCPYADELCRQEDPMLRLRAGSQSHSAACHFTDKLELGGVVEFAPAETN